jgi:hypothetical protein
MAKFYFSDLLPTTLVMVSDGDIFGIPMTGNRQYGWDKRQKLYLSQTLLKPVGNVHMQRLVAHAQGVPSKHLPS